MLVISNVDGTIADNRHRLGKVDNPADFWSLVSQDTPNPVGIELIQTLKKDHNISLVLITTRPSHYTDANGKRVNLYKETKHWLHEVADIHTSEVFMRDAAKSDEEKVERIVRLVLEHIIHRRIVVIDSDISILQQVKERCPTVTAYHVNYDSYEKIM